MYGFIYFRFHCTLYLPIDPLTGRRKGIGTYSRFHCFCKRRFHFTRTPSTQRGLRSVAPHLLLDNRLEGNLCALQLCTFNCVGSTQGFGWESRHQPEPCRCVAAAHDTSRQISNGGGDGQTHGTALSIGESDLDGSDGGVDVIVTRRRKGRHFKESVLVVIVGCDSAVLVTAERLSRPRKRSERFDIFFGALVDQSNRHIAAAAADSFGQRQEFGWGPTLREVLKEFAIVGIVQSTVRTVVYDKSGPILQGKPREK